jgi:hypothetical protein
MTADQELAWLAGFFSGEGSVLVARPHAAARLYLHLSLVNSDHDAVLRFQRRFGGSVDRRVPRKAGHKVLWLWRCRRIDDARAALDALHPYLSVDKRAQADECLRQMAEQGPPPRGANLRRGTPLPATA